MIYLVLLSSCVVFVELFLLLDLKREALQIAGLSRETLAVVMSSELGDEAKETFMRRASIDVFGATCRLVGKFLAILAVLYAIFWLASTLSPELGDRIVESFVSPSIIIGLTILTAAYVWARNVVRKQL